MPKGIKNFYFYRVHSQQDNGDNTDETIITRYFRTAEEVAAYIGCVRSTVFNLVKDPENRIYGKHYVVEKCRIPSIEKVPVSNFEKW